MFSQDESGIATILGMLIFIGVLFTCVIPLFLYVNQVNSFYDRTVVDMRQFDQNKERERIDVFAYPLSSPFDYFLNIYIKNKFPLLVKIVRVWVNDEYFEPSFEIPAMGDGLIEHINISDMLPGNAGEKKSFYIKVTTARGNSFSSFTNPLCYTDGSGWSGGTGLTIQVIIETSKTGQCFFCVVVSGPPGFPDYFANVEKRPHESSCFTVVTVPYEGAYKVTVKWETGQIIEQDIPVSVDLSHPSQWVYVNAE